MQKILKDIKECILSKWIGCFVALPAVLLTFIQIITYSLVSEQLYNPAVIVSSVFGVVLFIVLSLFRKTSPLAPVVLMVCDMCAFFGFVGAGDGVIDVFSTLFFDGFSFDKFFAMPGAEWWSVLSFILTIIISSVAMYLPQNRKEKPVETENEEVSE